METNTTIFNNINDFSNIEYLKEVNIKNDLKIRKAAKYGHLEVLKYLVSKCANLRNFNELPLRLATENGHLEVVKYLVSIGANPRMDDDLPLRLAAENGHLEVVMYFVSKGANTRIYNDISLYRSTLNGHTEIVKYLISKGANVKILSKWAINYSSKLGYFELVKYLISKGVDPIKVLDERCNNYLSFCRKMEEKKRLRAQKKIYFWWIQICYDPETKVGQRMLENKWLEFDKIQKKN